MNHDKSQPLTGKDNQRINKISKSDNESTAAWAGTDHKEAHSKVSIPSTNAVLNAKEWVDNGSRL